MNFNQCLDVDASARAWPWGCPEGGIFVLCGYWAIEENRGVMLESHGVRLGWR